MGIKQQVGGLVVGTLVVAGLIGVGGPPAGAADVPVVTATPMSVDNGQGFTVTLTGCEGPGAPKIVKYGNIYLPKSSDIPVSIMESTPGVWKTTNEAGDYSDQIYFGICASGARSAGVRVDVDWREMFTDPFLSTPPAPLKGVTGTDCSTGEPVVVSFRMGERVWEVRPKIDASGNWFAGAPAGLPTHGTATVIGRCGDWRYIPVSWTTERPPIHYPPAQGFLSPGDGPIGTTITGNYLCDAVPTVLLNHPGDDFFVPVPIEAASAGTLGYRWTGTAIDTDSRYTVNCGKQVDVLTFDVDAPKVRLGPVGSVADPTPRWLEGTDCPDGTSVTVTYAHGSTSEPHTAAIDTFGDWQVPLPRVAAGTRVVATASCGRVTYASLAYDAGGATTTTSQGPGVTQDPNTAAPAEAVPGTSSFTG